MGNASSSPATNPRDGLCPCGSGRPFDVCCGAIHQGERLASTAEELMRARFSAHVVHDFKFLHESYEETARKPFVPDEQEATTEWTRLAVHAHEPGATPDIAYVDFSAYGKENGAEVVLHEKAQFRRHDGKWLYQKAVRLGPAPVKAAPKVGRNDPCPCGSGKKYKHCCLK
jgi:SEC-C motif domain protein